MQIVGVIAYAGEPKPALTVCGVRPMEDYMLWVRFNTGEQRIYDFKPLLAKDAFAPLKDIEVFNSVYIDCVVTVWNDGDIAITPEQLYNTGAAAKSENIA